MITARDNDQSMEQFVGWETYLKNHHSMGGEVFKSRDSLEWFHRRHANIASSRLVPGGAQICLWPPFTKVALEN